jgi:hypothetical protein
MTRLTLGQAGRLRSQRGQILRRAQDDGGDGLAVVADAEVDSV